MPETTAAAYRCLPATLSITAGFARIFHVAGHVHIAPAPDLPGNMRRASIRYRLEPVRRPNSPKPHEDSQR